MKPELPARSIDDRQGYIDLMSGGELRDVRHDVVEVGLAGSMAGAEPSSVPSHGLFIRIQADDDNAAG